MSDESSKEYRDCSKTVVTVRRDGRVVEGASLENWNTGNCIGGSNPSLSAMCFIILYLATGDTYTDPELDLEASPHGQQTIQRS